MSTQKAKFELYQRLAELGFTYEEATQLRRIQLTLHRWAEEECNGTIQRHDDGKPFRQYPDAILRANELPIADREAGALRRLKGIVLDRNRRLGGNAGKSWGNWIVPYHQTDPRGCALYLVRRADLRGQPIEQIYNRGLAVCC